MKKQYFIAFVIAGSLSVSSGRAEKVQLKDLPSSVQTTINSQAGTSMVSDIDRETRDGKVVYQVSVKKEGKNENFSVSEDGSLLKEKKGISLSNELKLPSLKKEKLQLTDLPQPVQDTVRGQAGTGEIVDIDKEMRDGKATYEIEFKQEGLNKDIWVAEDGSLLPPKKGEGPIRDLKAAVAGKKLQMSDLPDAVQNTLRSRAGTSEIADIDRKEKNGQVIYEVEVKREGKNEEFFIAEDGSIIESAGAGTGVINKIERQFEKLDNKVDGLRRTEKTRFSDLPEAVQKTAREQAGTGEIVDVDKETRDGRAVYEIEFKRDGKNTDIQVNEDGSLVEKKF